MYECETCTDEFWDEDDCFEHMDMYDHWPECETCSREFRTQRAANQHMNARGHWAERFECDTCTASFRSQYLADLHMDDYGHHEPSFPCETCSARFYTNGAAFRHMKKHRHFERYCAPCDRHFMNRNNLEMHLKSKTHVGSRITCPFCKANHTTASGLVHHLEAGFCSHAPQLNRETILDIVRERDPQNRITNRLIEWTDNENVQWSATQNAFNGSFWECDKCGRGFRSIGALNTHLNSPTHKQKVYHCPNVRTKCGKEFVTLAALFNHLESESCDFMRFEGVQKQVGDIFQGRRYISF